MARVLADPIVASRIQQEIKIILNGCRLVLNLEGVAVPELPINLEGNTLAMPMALALNWMRALNVVAVSVANNHARDLGAEALDAMVDRIGDSGIIVLRPGAVTDLGSFRLVALSDLDNFSSIGAGAVTDEDFETLGRSEARPPLFAFLHWGTEYAVEPGEREKNIALKLQRAAVQLIVGAHSHVAGTALTARAGGQGLTAHALGNFLFDQSSRRSSGTILEVRVFDQGTFYARLVPIPNFFDRARLLRQLELPR
jgi:poly-gamma-glutamate synthesis protein (capsule biosynthesis protein)